MKLEITPVVKGEKIHFKNPDPAFYEAIGGKEGMEKLMYSFYVHPDLRRAQSL